MRSERGSAIQPLSQCPSRSFRRVRWCDTRGRQARDTELAERACVRVRARSWGQLGETAKGECASAPPTCIRARAHARAHFPPNRGHIPRPDTGARAPCTVGDRRRKCGVIRQLQRQWGGISSLTFHGPIRKLTKLPQSAHRAEKAPGGYGPLQPSCCLPPASLSARFSHALL